MADVDLKDAAQAAKLDAAIYASWSPEVNAITVTPDSAQRRAKAQEMFNAGKLTLFQAQVFALDTYPHVIVDRGRIEGLPYSLDPDAYPKYPDPGASAQPVTQFIGDKTGMQKDGKDLYYVYENVKTPVAGAIEVQDGKIYQIIAFAGGPAIGITWRAVLIGATL